MQGTSVYAVLAAQATSQDPSSPELELHLLRLELDRQDFCIESKGR